MTSSALLCLAALGILQGAQEPLLIAHRGLTAVAPENTMPALRAAWSRGFCVEIDVRASRDGTPVVIHDATLDRTTDGTGPVAARTLEELRRLDAGGWFSERFRGVRIPTLEEVLTAAAETPRTGLVALEVKTPGPGFDERIAHLVARTGMRDRVFVFGIGAASARRFARADPDLSLAAVAVAPAVLDAWLRLGADGPYRDVWTLFAPTAAQVAAVHARGGRVWTWDRARPAGPELWSVGAAARAAGVDGLCTDHPAPLLERWKDRAPARGAGDHEFVLGNGLRVVLTPWRGADRVAVALLLEIGERHDPRGRSGMAHLLEHLLVTCRAGERPSRTAQEFFAAHPLGANAQTAEDHTLVAVVVRPDRLADILGDLAARLRDLEIGAADLERELPRLERELANMFGGIPALGARNLAREIALPLPAGARRGGVVEQLRATTPGELRERHRRLYHPGHAILSLAGDFEPKTARAAIEAGFGPLERGESLPPLRPRAPRPRPFATRLERPAAPGERSSVHLALAIPAPPLTADDAGAFLILAARLQTAVPRIARRLDAKLRARVSWAPLDDPAVLLVQATGSGAASRRPEDLLDRLRIALLEAAHLRREELQGARTYARVAYGRLLGLQGGPAGWLLSGRGDPYVVALREAQRVHAGWDPRALEAALEAATVEDVDRLAQRVLARERCGAAAVLVR